MITIQNNKILNTLGDELASIPERCTKIGFDYEVFQELMKDFLLKNEGLDITVEDLGLKEVTGIIMRAYDGEGLVDEESFSFDEYAIY